MGNLMSSWSLRTENIDEIRVHNESMNDQQYDIIERKQYTLDLGILLTYFEVYDN